MSRGSILVSVITVVRNDSQALERTMDSIASQDYSPMEYVIVDGASNDGTCDVLQRRKSEIDKCISEPDSGIFDAMNKGIRLVSGEYVCFMNAGDRFASQDVVSRMFIPRPRTELLWGDCIVESRKGEEYDRAVNVLKRLHRQMTVCHQSLFVKRSALLARPFDVVSFPVAADYDFLCDRLLSGASWEYRPLPVSRVDDRGSSTRLFRTNIQEKRRIALARFPEKRLAVLFHSLLLELYMNAKVILKGVRGR